jgi:hypothetical protein
MPPFRVEIEEALARTDVEQLSLEGVTFEYRNEVGFLGEGYRLGQTLSNFQYGSGPLPALKAGLALLLERQDTFGALYNYPRTFAFLYDPEGPSAPEGLLDAHAFDRLVMVYDLKPGVLVKSVSFLRDARRADARVVPVDVVEMRFVDDARRVPGVMAPFDDLVVHAAREADVRAVTVADDAPERAALAFAEVLFRDRTTRFPADGGASARSAAPFVADKDMVNRALLTGHFPPAQADVDDTQPIRAAVALSDLDLALVARDLLNVGGDARTAARVAQHASGEPLDDGESSLASTFSPLSAHSSDGE